MVTTPTDRFDRSILVDLPGFCGRIHPVFHTAAIVSDPSGLPVLTLLHPSRLLVPFGIAYPLAFSSELDGCVLSLDGRSLTVARPGKILCHITLSADGIDLRVDRPGPCDLALVRAQITQVDWPERTRALRGQKLPANDHDLFLPVLARALASPIRILRAPFVDDRALRDALAALVGLGPGMTPSGDDVIAGMLAAAYRLAAGHCWSADRLDALCGAVRDLPTGVTTMTSLQMLRHARNGRFVEPLCRLVRHLGTKGIDLSSDAVYLSQCGAHSGCDMMAGALAIFEGL